jgi:DNA mismatch repair protein MutS
MVEMTEAATIHRATHKASCDRRDRPRHSTFDGASPGRSRGIAEKNRSLALFATHWFELTALPAEIDGCANLHSTPSSTPRNRVPAQGQEGPANRSYVPRVASSPACRPP